MKIRTIASWASAVALSALAFAGPARALDQWPVTETPECISGNTEFPIRFQGGGARLASENGQVTLTFQTDGNVVVQENGVPTWATATEVPDIGAVFPRLVFQSDGNLVLYHMIPGSVIKNTVTAGNPGTELCVQDDGNVVIKKSDGAVVWSLEQRQSFFINLRPNVPTTIVSPVTATHEFAPNEIIRSANSQVKLTFQSDGNLVVQENGKPTWATMTHDKAQIAVFQDDGNLVLYSGGTTASHAVKSTETRGGTKLVVQNDGNVTIEKADGTVVWALNEDPDHFFTQLK